MSAIQICSTLYPPRSFANIFGNRHNGADPRFKILIRVEASVIIWSLWLCRNDKILAIKMLLLCRLSTDAQLRFVRGGIYTVWSTEVSTQLEKMARDTYSIRMAT